MKHFTKTSCINLFKTGDYKYDFDASNFRTEHQVMPKLGTLETNEIEEFLNYHFEANEYPNVFLMVIARHCFKQVISNDNKNIFLGWLSSKSTLDKRRMEVAFVMFREMQEDGHDYDPLEWENNLIRFLNGKRSSEMKPFLNFAEALLQEGLSLHSLTCTNSFDCPIDQAYNERKEAVKKYYIHMIKMEEEAYQNEAETTKVKNKNFTKLQWLGTQKQLGELFIELKKNGWIGGYEYDTIKTCFTNSNTIQQVLKPSMDTRTGIEEYEQVYTPQYDPKFHGIKNNPKN